MTHVQLVKTIVENLRRVGDRGVAEHLSKAQHFEIDLDLYIAAGKFVWELFQDSEFFIDSIARPPSNPATFRLGEEATVFFMRTQGPVVVVEQLGADGATYRRFRWEPGTNKMEAHSTFEQETDEILFRLILTGLTLGMMLSLINSPKLVDVSRSSPRQERREASRTFNLPVDAWHRVSWRTAAGRDVSASGSEEPGSKKPLHYRRGHVRTAQSHFHGAFATSLTETGWGQWIDGQWVGHPAFGIKKSIHTPTLDRKGLSEFMKRNQNHG
jgi:hypothetical protein